MRETYFENMEPLSMKPSGTTLADAGFQSSATSQYTESDSDAGPATTFTKVTTSNSENVLYGIGSGRVVNAAAGGYIRQRYNVQEREQFYWHILSRLDSGANFEAVLQDVTNAAAIGTTIEHAEEAWQWVRRNEHVPDNCKIMETRYQGEGTTDDFYLNAQCLLFPDHPYVELDTKWDSRTELKLMAVELGGNQLSNNVWPARASRLVEIPRSDYSFRMERPGANPYAVQFQNGSQKHWFQYPVYIQGRRSYADLTAFTLALTETTANELDQAESRTRMEMFRTGGTCAFVPGAAGLYAEAQRANAVAAGGQRIDGPQERGRRAGWFKVPS